MNRELIERLATSMAAEIRTFMMTNMMGYEPCQEILMALPEALALTYGRMYSVMPAEIQSRMDTIRLSNTDCDCPDCTIGFKGVAMTVKEILPNG
jgi:hypothetical protein